MLVSISFVDPVMLSVVLFENCHKKLLYFQIYRCFENRYDAILKSECSI